MQSKKAKILIVDDNRIIREVLRGLIRHDEKLQVVGTAANGETALELVGSLKPDLVCLDVLMPGLDGIAVLRAIHAAHSGTRVIVISGESKPDIVSRALLAGASGFVVKPFNAEKVLRSIHIALKAPVPVCRPEPEAPPAEPEPGDAGSGISAAAEPVHSDAMSDAAGATAQDSPADSKAPEQAGAVA